MEKTCKQMKAVVEGIAKEKGVVATDKISVMAGGIDF